MKNKGFTLMELLGVIILLGVISAIVTSAVMGRIDKAKKDSAMNSAKNYIKTVNEYMIKAVYMNEEASNIIENWFANSTEPTTTLTKSNKIYLTENNTNKISGEYDSFNLFLGITKENSNSVKKDYPNGDKDYVILNNSYVVIESLMTISGNTIKYTKNNNVEEFCFYNIVDNTCEV